MNTVQSKTSVIHDLLTGEGSYATALLTWLLDHYGPDVLTWHPETISLELQDDFKIRPPSFILDRIMAGICVLTTDSFYKNLPKFIQLCNVLSGDDFNPRVFDIADAGECAWGITEALLLDPPDEDDPEPFCDDIRYYLGAVLRNEGFISPPDILAIALDANWSDKIKFEFGDDPDMQGAIYDVQKGRADEIVEMIKEGLLGLRRQIFSLPLRNGKTDVLQKIDTLWRYQNDG